MSSDLEDYIDNRHYYNADADAAAAAAAAAAEEEELVYDISVSMSILENIEKYYELNENGTTLKDHIRSVKNGLEFLGKLYLLSMDEHLASRVKLLAADVKHTLTSCEEENGVLDIIKLEHIYEELRRKMRSLATLAMSVQMEDMLIFQADLHSTHKYRRTIDLLSENLFELLSTWYINNNATADDQTTTLVKKVRELMVSLSCLKPLCRCLAHPSCLPHLFVHKPLDLVLNRAAAAIYRLLVGEMDVETAVIYILRITSHERIWGTYVRFLKFNSSEISSDVKGQFYMLDNLMHILAMNLDSLNDANNHLYVNLRELRNFVANQRGSNERLDHYMGLTASTESICYQALPIVYSCYLEEIELEEEMRQKLNDILVFVIGQIKLMMCHHGSQEVKLYDYPRLDYLGYLEFFLGNLKELQGHEHISVIRSEIEAIHADIQCLMSSTNTSQEELISEGLWTHIVGLAYQVEYVIDLYLLTPDSCCISTLSNIVEAVKEIKEKVMLYRIKAYMSKMLM